MGVHRFGCQIAQSSALPGRLSAIKPSEFHLELLVPKALAASELRPGNIQDNLNSSVLASRIRSMACSSAAERRTAQHWNCALAQYSKRAHP